METNILICIDGVSLHKLTNKEKTFYTKGLCKIVQVQDSYQPPAYYLKLNSFYFTLSKTVVFVKIQFEDSVSYLFELFDQGLTTVSLERNEENIKRLESVIEKVAILKIFDKALHDDGFYQKIERNCPSIDKEPLQKKGKLMNPKQIGRKIGAGIKFLGNQTLQILQGITKLI